MAEYASALCDIVCSQTESKPNSRHVDKRCNRTKWLILVSSCSFGSEIVCGREAEIQGTECCPQVWRLPLPRFEETTSTLAGSRLFTVLDCFSSFWQIYIHEPHRQKSAFTVPDGHYEFNRMPYGISNNPASFQRWMHSVLRNLIGPEYRIFIDDYSIFSETVQKHANRLTF
jgi:Reverse transcriptase (RNA-dependent DNA polymerase).